MNLPRLSSLSTVNFLEKRWKFGKVKGKSYTHWGNQAQGRIWQNRSKVTKELRTRLWSLGAPNTSILHWPMLYTYKVISYMVIDLWAKGRSYYLYCTRRKPCCFFPFYYHFAFEMEKGIWRTEPVFWLTNLFYDCYQG